MLAGALAPAGVRAQVAGPARAASLPPLRVDLLAPTVAAAEPGLALLRAELSAGGFSVEERPAPGPPTPGWLDGLREAGAFATVVPDPEGARAAALVLVYGSGATDSRRHAIDLGDLAPLSEAEALRRLTALAVRVSEVLQAHAREHASAPPPAAPTAVPAPPPPGDVRLQAGLTAGGAVTGVGSAVGPSLALSGHDRQRRLLRLSLVGPSLARAVRAPAGALRVWGSQALLELGYEPTAAGRVAAVIAAGAGVQHVLASPLPGPVFPRRLENAVAPLVGLSVGLALRLSAGLSAVGSLRIQGLVTRPGVWIDGVRVARAPRLLNLASVGLQLNL